MFALKAVRSWEVRPLYQLFIVYIPLTPCTLINTRCSSSEGLMLCLFCQFVFHLSCCPLSYLYLTLLCQFCFNRSFFLLASCPKDSFYYSVCRLLLPIICYRTTTYLFCFIAYVRLQRLLPFSFQPPILTFLLFPLRILN